MLERWSDGRLYVFGAILVQKAKSIIDSKKSMVYGPKRIVDLSNEFSSPMILPMACIFYPPKQNRNVLLC